jgi:hypothetical protein
MRADPAEIWRLRLCGYPRSDRWHAETAQLAALVGADVGVLRTLLRALGVRPRGDSLLPRRPDRASADAVRPVHEHLPLSFEVNRGQPDPQVEDLARGSGYTAFLTRGEVVLAPRPPACLRPVRTLRGLQRARSSPGARTAAATSEPSFPDTAPAHPLPALLSAANPG